MNKPRAVLIDCDGTLVNVESIRHHVLSHPRDFPRFHSESIDCPPHAIAVDIARTCHAEGVAVIIVTARRARWRHTTAFWLAMHDVPSDAMFMRADDDERSDVEVKRTILARIRQTWTPVLAVDDNPEVVKLWQSEGIPTIVIPGWVPADPKPSEIAAARQRHPSSR